MGQHSNSRSSYFRWALGLLSLMLTCAKGNTCDTFSIQLQATFPQHVAIPCTDDEYEIISALLHSLVQTDVILGLQRMPISEILLAFETYGPGVAKFTAFDEEDFMTTQLELSLPHLTPEDTLEDMYYAVDHTQGNMTHSNTTEGISVNSTGGNGGNQTIDIIVSMSSEVVNASEGTNSRGSLIEPFEDSLRQGDRKEEGNNKDDIKTVVDPYVVEDHSQRHRFLMNASDSSETDHSSLSTLVSSLLSNDSMASECAFDWCGHFVSRPCQATTKVAIDHAQMQQFQIRVATAIEKKLRKWARDTDCMCLGNSWELRAVVNKI